MTPSQKSSLDRMFQINVLEKWKHRSLLSGRVATVVHHFFTRKNESTRWYVPNGIPLTHEEHMAIHSTHKKEYNQQLIDLLGQDWYEDLRSKVRRIGKYIKVNRVKAHLNGHIPDYIDNWYL